MRAAVRAVRGAGAGPPRGRRARRLHAKRVDDLQEGSRRGRLSATRRSRSRPSGTSTRTFTRWTTRPCSTSCRTSARGRRYPAKRCRLRRLRRTSRAMTSAVTLALAGDVMLGRGVNRRIGEHGFAYPWGNLLPTLRRADCFLINLECALTEPHRTVARRRPQAVLLSGQSARGRDAAARRGGLRRAGQQPRGRLRDDRAAGHGPSPRRGRHRPRRRRRRPRGGAGAGVLDRRRVAHRRRRVCRLPRRLGRGSDLTGHQLHAGLARVRPTSQPSSRRTDHRPPAGRSGHLLDPLGTKHAGPTDPGVPRPSPAA